MSLSLISVFEVGGLPLNYFVMLYRVLMSPLRQAASASLASCSKFLLSCVQFFFISLSYCYTVIVFSFLLSSYSSQNFSFICHISLTNVYVFSDIYNVLLADLLEKTDSFFT